MPVIAPLAQHFRSIRRRSSSRSIVVQHRMPHRQQLLTRAEGRASDWGVTPERVLHRAGSVIVFGRCQGTDVVMKVVRQSTGEWFSGSVLEAFRGDGVVRVLKYEDGAVLMERLAPGTLLADTGISDRDATAVIADVIARMNPGSPPATVPRVHEWGRSFERHAASPPSAIPTAIFNVAHGTFRALCDSQTEVRLLHGDLHHRNVLSDSSRGWVAIDPKGVVGERAFEAGAALRNPCERPEIFTNPVTIRERVEVFSRALALDRSRLLQWAFAQAVLAAVWEWEDRGALDAGRGWIALADTILAEGSSLHS